jgi:hypothetical protein
MSQTSYNFKVKGSDKPSEVSLDPNQKLSIGDTVSLKDGKRAKIKSLTLNVQTGKYDVETEDVLAEGTQRPTAEGNDPHPERKAVKEVVNDPIFTPAVSDVHRPASENAEILAGEVQTGGTATLKDEKGEKRPAGREVPAAEQKARLERERGQHRQQPAQRAPEKRTDETHSRSEGSKNPADTAAIRR